MATTSTRKLWRTLLVALAGTVVVFPFLSRPFYGTDQISAWFPTSSSTPRSGTITQADPELFKGFMLKPNAIPTDYYQYNTVALVNLHACLATRSCGVNQAKVAILDSNWFRQGIAEGWKGGEGVWGQSIYNSLTNLGYTCIVAISVDEVYRYYRQMPDLVKIIITEHVPLMDQDPKYMESVEHPDGIPIWKLFWMTFFPNRGQGVLKGKWTINAVKHPYDSDSYNYLGYSIEDHCNSVPFVPLADRPEQAWLFAKQATYFYKSAFAWERTWFNNLTRDVPGLSVKGAFSVDEHYQWNPDKDGHFDNVPGGLVGVENVGRIGPEQFNDELSHSRVLLGVGDPWYSPSPFYSLCFGVPFINVVRKWNEAKPDERWNWDVQQPELVTWDPPYVYHVKSKDYDGLVSALKQAMTVPIPRTILPHMTQAEHELRMQALMETDWYDEAVQELERRKESGGKLFYVKM
ncbi:hypothetical protein FFLO_05698 [Filobasidium floriforme]|uniref:Uncharacterized protein n=1 Tax=Filobasidium floriforme TaxID=5210 RepID=A0A8K0JGB6_9TREE|nr:uncharacterized protein HD553DRAFT_337369 [Filobasidium floriforme]KAG7529383.1 hypothetical protein FFLO_05698 [Filobasidium floriforme]KAH8079388.1 hypothetical protein HD553DRAFT_337369 [Filobasidium floriforme]